MLTVADILKSARERAGLDVHEAAYIAGVHRSVILSVENGLGLWQSARQIARMLAKRRLRVVAHRDRKQTTNAVAELADVRFETAQQVLELIANPDSLANPQIRNVERVVAALNGRVELH